VIKGLYPDYKSRKFLVLCGPGNNGGDGAVLARLLFVSGAHVSVVYTGEIEKSGDEARINFSIIGKLGIEIQKLPQEIPEADIIVDAIFGVGFHGEPDKYSAHIIDSINKSGKTIFSIDIPSGLQADGKASAHTVRADYTVTFGLEKLGMADFPGRTLAGRVFIETISIPPALVNDSSIINNLVGYKDILETYSPRKRDTNKGSYGHLLLAGGMAGMSGAVILAGKAALKAGAGLLTISAADGLLGPIRRNFPEALTIPLGEDIAGYSEKRKIRTALAGNGLGTGDFQKSILKNLLSDRHIERLVIDADGLNNIALYPGLALAMKNSQAERILTPHIGEMARLVNRDNSWVKNNKVDCARQFAYDNKIFLVLKDAVTIIAGPGGDIYISGTGSASLAKGGSGDILAGLIAGLWASGYPALESCKLGTYLLGRAGEIYEEKWGSESAIARDILKLIPAVFSDINRDFSRSA
jgi:NAD(P)H-hydrate epimerase